MDDNKKKALAAALGQIERQFGKGAVMRMGDHDRQRFLPSPPVRWVWTSHSVSAVCLKAGSWKSTVPSLPVKPR